MALDSLLPFLFLLFLFFGGGRGGLLFFFCTNRDAPCMLARGPSGSGTHAGCLPGVEAGCPLRPATDL